MPAEDALSVVGPESLPVLLALGEVLELGVVALDADLVIRRWNRWMVAASNLAEADVAGRPLSEVFPEVPGSAAEGALRRALAGGTTVWAHRFHRYLLPLPAPSGHARFDQMQQSARIIPVLRDGQIDGIVLLLQDVTERVAREEELRGALESAQTANLAKSEFLASMSHELRTPLSAIVGYMEVMASEMVGPVSPLQKDYLGRVKSAAGHLLSIIEEILTFSRVEAGKEDVHWEPVDVAAVARDAEQLFEPQALRKGLALSVAVPAAPVVVVTDGTKLRQVLINLLGNAVKFTDVGSVSLDMTLTDDRVVFCVRDTGPGIPSEDLERVFEPFTQVDQSHKRPKGGTGLGLPVSRQLANLLGGGLTVTSVPHRETVFTCWLPRNVGVPERAHARGEAVSATPPA